VLTTRPDQSPSQKTAAGCGHTGGHQGERRVKPIVAREPFSPYYQSGDQPHVAGVRRPTGGDSLTAVDKLCVVGAQLDEPFARDEGLRSATLLWLVMVRGTRGLSGNRANEVALEGIRRSFTVITGRAGPI
jgi:hypothetical protein